MAPAVASIDSTNIPCGGASLTPEPGGDTSSMAAVFAALTEKQPPPKCKNIVVLLGGPAGKHTANLGMRVDEPHIQLTHVAFRERFLAVWAKIDYGPLLAEKGCVLLLHGIDWERGAAVVAAEINVRKVAVHWEGVHGPIQAGFPINLGPTAAPGIRRRQ